MGLIFGGMAVGGALGALAGEGATYALAKDALHEYMDDELLRTEGSALSEIGRIGKLSGAISGTAGGAAAGAYFEFNTQK